jgi:predicted PurR-regulated permease PerM
MAKPPENEWETAGHERTLVVLGCTVAGVYLCYRMALPFLPVLTWAFALAVVFAPFQRWLESKFKRPGAAALVAVLLIGLMVVVPAIFVAQRLMVEAARAAQAVQTKVDSGEWQRLLESQPQLKPWVDRIETEIDVPGTVRSVATWLSTTAGSIVKRSLVQALGFCLIFYMLFFLLRDRRMGIEALRSASPLTAPEMNHLLIRVGDTIHATIYGTLAVAALQGLLGGLMFWALGVPGPLLWGVVMALLAVVPVLGAFVIWVPAVIFLALAGNPGKAVILAAWGMLVVGTIDNLLRPILVGNRLKLHTGIVFIAVLGGLMVFGGAGLILGPVVFTLTLVLLELWPHRAVTGMKVKPEYLSRWENEGGLEGPEAGAIP